MQQHIVSSRAKGFTLIELVATIVLLGILAVNVAPKFTGRSGMAEYALRDQIISTIRFAQQRAMYDHSGRCYTVVIDSFGVSAEQNGALITGTKAIFFSGDYQGLSATPMTLSFDGIGNVNNNGSDCASSTALVTPQIILAGGATPLVINISAAGYVSKP